VKVPLTCGEGNQWKSLRGRARTAKEKTHLRLLGERRFDLLKRTPGLLSIRGVGGIAEGSGVDSACIDNRLVDEAVVGSGSGIDGSASHGRNEGNSPGVDGEDAGGGEVGRDVFPPGSSRVRGLRVIAMEKRGRG
jgi:hypothetical protein